MTRKMTGKSATTAFTSVAICALTVSLNPAWAQTHHQEQESRTATQSGTVPPLDLSESQLATLRDAVASRDTHQPAPKGFAASPGGEVPSAINLHPLPRPLIYDIPTLQQYWYARLDDSIIIVNGVSKQIATTVALAPAQVTPPDNPMPDQSVAAQGRSVTGLIELDAQEREWIFAAAQGEPQSAPDSRALVAGSQIPAGMTLQPLPQDVGMRLPSVRNLHFAVLEDGRVILADAATRKVAGILSRDTNPVAPARGATTGSEVGAGDRSNARDPLSPEGHDGTPSAYTTPQNSGSDTQQQAK